MRPSAGFSPRRRVGGRGGGKTLPHHPTRRTRQRKAPQPPARDILFFQSLFSYLRAFLVCVTSVCSLSLPRSPQTTFPHLPKIQFLQRWGLKTFSSSASHPRAPPPPNPPRANGRSGAVCSHAGSYSTGAPYPPHTFRPFFFREWCVALGMLITACHPHGEKRTPSRWLASRRLLIARGTQRAAQRGPGEREPADVWHISRR